MPVEIIGEVGTPCADPEWISAQATLAIRHIVKLCGLPPPEMELEVQWQEHELGDYPTIVPLWEDAMRGTPWNYLERCRVARRLRLTRKAVSFLSAGQCRPSVRKTTTQIVLPSILTRHRPTHRKRLTSSKSQRYISKLIQWGLEASKRRRSRPHLVERDDDEQRILTEKQRSMNWSVLLQIKASSSSMQSRCRRARCVTIIVGKRDVPAMGTRRRRDYGGLQAEISP